METRLSDALWSHIGIKYADGNMSGNASTVCRNIRQLRFERMDKVGWVGIDLMETYVKEGLQKTMLHAFSFSWGLQNWV